MDQVKPSCLNVGCGAERGSSSVAAEHTLFTLRKHVIGRFPVLKICFGPPTAESKNLKNHVNFDVGDLFFRSPALWSSQNVFGPPTAGRVVVDFKDRDISVTYIFLNDCALNKNRAQFP